MLDHLLLTGSIPEIKWEHGDDLCDCTFQRIGWWTNPYLGRTMEIRLCCAWAKLIELHPEIQPYYREIPAFDNYNTGRYESEPAAWDAADHDMPRALWHRQLSIQTGKPLEQIRREYDHLEPPKAVLRPKQTEPIGSILEYLNSEALTAGLDIKITNIE